MYILKEPSYGYRTKESARDDLLDSFESGVRHIGPNKITISHVTKEDVVTWC